MTSGRKTLRVQATANEDRAGVISRDSWTRAASSLSPLWVVGAGFMCALIGYLVAPVFSSVVIRSAIWIPYVLLGTLFPLVLVMVVVAQRAGYRFPRALRLTCVAVAFAAAAAIAGPAHVIVALALAQIQLAVWMLFARRTQAFTFTRLLIAAAASFLAWAACLELFTWEPLQSRLPVTWGLMLTGGVALIAATAWSVGQPAESRERRQYAKVTIDILAVSVLVLCAFRTDGLFVTDRLSEDGAIHHWSPFVSAAAAVRQGGWLLWDTPSLYGFLNVLFLARLPTASTWQSVYLADAVCASLLAIWLYFLIRRVGNTVFSGLFALLVVLTVLFLVSSYPPMLTPLHYYPHSGVFRYGWCYFLIALLLSETCVPRASRQHQVILLAGNAAWLAAVLWSAESGVIGSAIWLPAFLFMILRDCGIFTEDRDWRCLVLWLSVPFIGVGVAGLVLAGIYLRGIGHLPDFQAYAEAAMSFSGTRVIDLDNRYDPLSFGKTATAGFFYMMVLATVAVAVASVRRHWRYLPLALGLTFGVWAFLSYPVGEVFFFAVFRLMPLIVLTLVIALSVIVPHTMKGGERSWANVLSHATVTLFSVLLVMVGANVSEFSYYASAIRGEPFIGTDVSRGLPRVDASLQQLLWDAGVEADDPIFNASSRFGNVMPVWIPAGQTDPVSTSRQWLAGQPISTFFVPNSRNKLYMARSTERRPTGGWLLQRMSGDGFVYKIDDWFFEQINRTHVPTKVRQNGQWRIVWYELLDPEETGIRSLPGDTEVPPILRDLIFDGKRVGTPSSSSLWGFFGPEWTIPAKNETGRCAAGQGTVWVYAPKTRSVTIVIELAQEQTQELVAWVNHARADELRPMNNGRQWVRAELNPGWNTIGLEPQGVRQSPEQKSRCGEAEAGSGDINITKINIKA